MISQKDAKKEKEKKKEISLNFLKKFRTTLYVLLNLNRYFLYEYIHCAYYQSYRRIRKIKINLRSIIMTLLPATANLLRKLVFYFSCVARFQW